MRLAVLLLALTAALVAAAPALAGEAAWTVAASSSPTNFVPNDETGDDTYVLKAVNTGEESTEGSRIELTDTLPSGLTATSISGEDLGNERALSCKLTPRLGCSYEGYEVAPGDVLQVTVVVAMKPGAVSPAVNAVTVSGGGAASSATSTDPTTLSSTPAHFGVGGFTATTSSTQAGAGSNLTVGFALNDTVAKGEYQPVALPKDVEISLPSGFLANLQGSSRCTSAQAQEETCGGSAVGVVFASTDSAVGEPPAAYSSVLYNVVPEFGELAALMFKFGGGWVRVEVGIGIESGYRMSLRVANIPEMMGLLSMEMTLDSGDVGGRGSGPDHVNSEMERYFGPSYGEVVAPSLFQEPGACGPPAPLSSLSADSWTQPGVLSEATSEAPMLTGCQHLPFDAALTVSPDVSQPAIPSGYALGLHFPRTRSSEGLESADPRDMTLTMPVGTGVSLSGTIGLESCTEAQFDVHSSAAEDCPNASKVGDMELLTPLLAHPLQGGIFLASPYANPFASLLAVYLVAEEPASGVFVKLAGELRTNPANGQLSLTIHELPQLHLETLKLHFFGESKALLTTPSSCGQFTAVSDLVPWSASAESVAQGSFEINNCTPRFEPSLQVEPGGGSNGSYESLLLIASHTSQEEQMQSLSLEVPDTLESALANATLCAWEQAENGTCPESSRVGEVALTNGPGPYQIYEQGSVYVTGPYEGAQAGLSIVFPLLAGPLDLGTVVMRAAMRPEPATGQASIVLDPLPTLVDGIPLWIDELAVLLEPGGGFTVDPTTCAPFAVAGNVTSTQDLSVSLSATLPAPAGCKPAPAGTGSSQSGSSSTPSSTAPVKASVKPKLELVCHFVKRGKKAKRKRVCKLEKAPKHKPKKGKKAGKKTTKVVKRGK